MTRHRPPGAAHGPPVDAEAGEFLPTAHIGVSERADAETAAARHELRRRGATSPSVNELHSDGAGRSGRALAGETRVGGLGLLDTSVHLVDEGLRTSGSPAATPFPPVASCTQG
jgi:hypothetical protein